jgi:hypothetical protein
MGQRSLPGTAAAEAASLADHADPADEPAGILPGAARSESLQRLQIGIFGLAMMILLVGLASIIGSQANLAEAAAVPDASPTTEPVTADSPQPNPLEDAGVVPDIAPETGLSPMVDPLAAPPKAVPSPPAPDRRTPR